MLKGFGLLAWCCVVLLSGCQLTATEQLQQRLMFQHFQLETINGQTVSDFLDMELDRPLTLELEFQQELLLAGSSGCNRFFGQSELSGQTLVLHRGGQTRMLCEPALMKLESQLLQGLRQGMKVTLHGDQLELQSAQLRLIYLRSYLP